MIYFSDVDVVLKLAKCGFLPLLPELLCVPSDEIQIRFLASLRFRLTRPNKKLTKSEYQQHLTQFCDTYSELPGVADVARQEELLAGGLDPGEAMLFAEAEAAGGIVVTGDKRALLAYSKASTKAQRAKIKVVCWEQLLLRVRRLKGYEGFRQGCCEGLADDGLLRLTFTNGLATEEEHAVAAIESYLGGIKAHSGDILATLDL